jgi:hypothetical protein
MSVLSAFKRIRVEDFSSKDRDLVSKLSYPINSFADQVLAAFNKQITIEDNLNITKKDISISLDSAGSIIGSANLKTGLDHLCQGILVIAVRNLTNPTSYPTGTPFVSYVENNGILTINNINNLPVSSQFQLKLILF